MRKILALPVVVIAFVFPSSVGATSAGRPVALVTAEISNEVLALSLGPHGGQVLRRAQLPHPVTIAAACTVAIALDPKGTVTLLDPRSLRRLAVLRSLRSPRIAAFLPGNEDLAYVTDAATGDVAVIDLATRKVVARVFVGVGAHHLAFSDTGRRLWIALGEDASTIVRLDVSHPLRPRVVGRLHPAVRSHDIAFAPGGRTAWVTSASADVVSVYAASDGRLLRTIPAGRAPQHLAFDHGRVLISSGYGSSLESVSQTTHRRLRLARSPYGSFNLATDGSLVLTTSLLTGEVSEFRLGNLHRLWTTKVAPEARSIAISACTHAA